MASLPTPPTCTHPSGPPCDRIIEDPETVLADRSQWPTHVCPGVAHASTVRWAQEHARRFYGCELPSAVADWTGMYPLPVGCGVMPPGVPEGLAPLPGFVRTGMILAPTIPFEDVRLFGPVEWAPMIPGGELAWIPWDLQVVIAGWDGERAATVTDQARRWWATLAALATPGRPKGSTLHTIDDYRRMFLEVTNRLGKPPTSLDQFVSACGLSGDTVKRNLNAAGTTWGAFRKAQI